MSQQSHWEGVYEHKSDEETSWYTPHLVTSLELIRSATSDRTLPVIDVGAGTSTLIEDLQADGFSDITVADISSVALERMRARLGAAAASVEWLVGDITTMELPVGRYGMWHDRAVFHFLVEEEQRRRYVEQVARAVRPGGHVIVATFSPEGPDKCSGLPVRRYDADGLSAEFGARFERVASRSETHVTPWGAAQAFTYCYCLRT